MLYDMGMLGSFSRRSSILHPHNETDRNHCSREINASLCGGAERMHTGIFNSMSLKFRCFAAGCCVAALSVIILKVTWPNVRGLYGRVGFHRYLEQLLFE